MADDAESPAIIEMRLLGSPDIASISVPPFSILKVPSTYLSIQEAVDAFEDKEKNKELELKYFEYIKQTNS